MRTKDIYQRWVPVTWLADGWFGVRVQFDPFLISAFKQEVAAKDRRWNEDAGQWEFAPAAYDTVKKALAEWWEVNLPPAPAAARRGTLPPLPPVTCVVCGARMSSARAGDRCGGMRPC